MPTYSEEFPHHEFISIDPRDLDPETVLDFALYVFNQPKNRFILYKQKNQEIGQERLDILTKDGIRPVYVHVTENFALQRYLSNNLGPMIEDPSIPLDKKTEKFHALASTVMQSLFDSPPDMKTFLSTARNVSDSFAKLIVAEPQAVLLLQRLRSYDYYTFSHSLNVTILTVGLYIDMHSHSTLDRIEDLTRGVLLHDIGKCDIPNEILNKRGPLTEEEWIIMKSHTTTGYERLKEDSALTEDSRLVALLHHEAMDGTGYPNALVKEEIPLTSRICKVIDVYDALSSKRSYKNRLMPFDSLLLMTNEMKNKLDMNILHRFIIYLQKMGKIHSEKRSLV